MKRRDFLKGAMAATCAAGLQPVRPAAARAMALPTPAQQTWQDCEVGVIYHFDMPVAAGDVAANNTTRKVFAPEKYNPQKLDTDQWLEAAKAVGAGYAVFTATHFNGFMQWQSGLYPYGVKQSPWRGGKGDVVGDFVASCRKAGIRPGIYFSTHRNVYWEVWGHYVDWGKGQGTAKQAAFNRVAEGMTEELCSRYGDLVQIWYDAGVMTPEEGGPDVLPIFERCQPNGVFYHSRQRSDHRWIGNEAGHAGDPCWAAMPGGDGVSHNAESWKPLLHNGDPEGAIWSPGMVDVPLRGAGGVHNWFWRPGEDEACHSVAALMRMYHESVGRNCNLVIGEVVTQDGLVPEADIARLDAFGKAVKARFGMPVAEAERVGPAGPCPATVEVALPKPQAIAHAVIMEDITQGERIRRYAVEGLVPGGAWAALSEGESVGHKRIASFAGREVAAVRLRITQATGEPHVRRFAVYGAEGQGLRS